MAKSDVYTRSGATGENGDNQKRYGETHKGHDRSAADANQEFEEQVFDGVPPPATLETEKKIG